MFLEIIYLREPPVDSGKIENKQFLSKLNRKKVNDLHLNQINTNCRHNKITRASSPSVGPMTERCLTFFYNPKLLRTKALNLL